MPSGPIGTRTHAEEAALGTDAVPRTTPVEGWPFRTEKRAFRFPQGQAPEKKGPETSRSSGEEGPSVAPAGPLVARTGPPGGIFSPSMCADAEPHMQKACTCRRYAHVEGTRRSVSAEGTLFPSREAPLRFLYQASSARTHADSTPLSDDRPTSETPRPQAGRVQFRRLHARRGLGGAGGRSHRALVPFSSIALGARCDRVALRRPACQAARQTSRRAPAGASESAAEAAFQCLPPPGTAEPVETWTRAPPNAPASPNTGSDT